MQGGDELKKNIYSIVLTDNVIRAVDAEAYRLGTNRSNLINQILAEHLSCVTPEMRMREIFDAAEMLLHKNMLLMQQNSPSVLMFRAALQYKYRPTVNYKVELERSPAVYMGTLKVQIRTQNQALINMFSEFFRLVEALERETAAELGVECYAADTADGCFVRRLVNNPQLEDEAKGGIIGNYINMLNKYLNDYLMVPENKLYCISAYGREMSVFMKNTA